MIFWVSKKAIMPPCSSKWQLLSKRGASPIMSATTGLRHRFQFASDIPLNASHAALRVNFLECWEWDGDQVHHFSWVTDLRMTKGTVYQLMRGGRARWRIENETCNTLKNQGYHFEHNYGHGYQHLSVVF